MGNTRSKSQLGKATETSKAKIGDKSKSKVGEKSKSKVEDKSKMKVGDKSKSKGALASKEGKIEQKIGISSKKQKIEWNKTLHLIRSLYDFEKIIIIKWS